jgi:hypothetical protein
MEFVEVSLLFAPNLLWILAASKSKNLKSILC